MPDSRKVRIVEPYPITYRFKVKSQFEGRTLLELMSSRFPFHGRRVWEEKIKDSRVGVNGKAAHAEYLLSRHDEVYHHNPKVVEPSVPDEVEVISQTDDYLIVFKPAPLPIHPGGRYNKNSLTTILKEKGYEDLRIVHRLDAVTSGLVLFARNKNFAQKAMVHFRESKVHKTYYALVAGIPQEKAITVDGPIRRKKGFVFESKPGLSKAKEATTYFELIEEGANSSIVKCHPRTGRTHQIRLHLKHWGHPIIDDPIYGIDEDQSGKTLPKSAISLLNAGLEIDSLGIKAQLDIPKSWRG